MFYFVIPTLIAPNGFNWLLPACQVSNSPINQQIGVEKANLDRSSFFQAETVSKGTQPLFMVYSKLKNQKQAEKPKICSNDQEYHPEVDLPKKFLKMAQLENRNLVPNAVRLILSFLQKKHKSEAIVQKLFKQQSLESRWSPKRFYLYQGIVKSKVNNYVNELTLKKLARLHPESFQMIGPDEQRFYNKIARILINYCLRDEFLCSVLTSKRMDKTKTYLQLSAHRKIKNNLKLLLEEPVHTF